MTSVCAPRPMSDRRGGPLFSKAGGAGAIQPEAVEAVEEFIASRSILGMPLDGGEIVILVVRRSLLVDSIAGALAAVVALALVWLVNEAAGASATLGAAALLAIAVGAGWFVIERSRRLYVLTDRRVVRTERRLTRTVHHQVPLQSVDRIELAVSDALRRTGVGTVLFRSGQGALGWSLVGDAERVHEIAEDALRRYGGPRRGM